MKIGPKYKIARRLGRSVFEKTQTAKFALSTEKRNGHVDGIRSRSNYGTQLLEKQKARFTYGITNTQLGKYTYKVIDSKVKNQEEMLFVSLEKRLDNVVLRSGFSPTRRLARQIVSHGHLKVNGVKNKVPSYSVKEGDIIEVKESSRDKALFTDMDEKLKDANIPAWIKVDTKAFTITITGKPTFDQKEIHFRLGDVLQFYKR
jgi:small subunit ribosomal protein S4